MCKAAVVSGFSIVFYPGTGFPLFWYLSCIVSRLSTALSISAIIASCFFLKSSSLNSIRWISLFRVLISPYPTFGSKVSCISSSSIIFLSHKRIYLSISTISDSKLAFSSFNWSISTSNLTDSFSKVFNFSVNS